MRPQFLFVIIALAVPALAVTWSLQNQLLAGKDLSHWPLGLAQEGTFNLLSDADIQVNALVLRNPGDDSLYVRQVGILLGPYVHARFQPGQFL
jgi:hypothetical protein